MALPALIEYLRSQRMPGALSPLFGENAQQNISLTFAAGTTSTITVSVAAGDFADLGYHIRPVRGMVDPNVFKVSVYQPGQSVVSGTVTESIIETGMDALLFITAAQPVTFALTNNDANNAHIWANEIFFLSIQDEWALRYMWALIANYANSGPLLPGLSAIQQTMEKTLTPQQKEQSIEPTLPVSGGRFQNDWPASATWPPKR